MATVTVHRAEPIDPPIPPIEKIVLELTESEARELASILLWRVSWSQNRVSASESVYKALEGAGIRG